MSKALALSVYLNHFDETPKNETMPAYATLKRHLEDVLHERMILKTRF